MGESLGDRGRTLALNGFQNEGDISDKFHYTK
jgi:hypothetical protein